MAWRGGRGYGWRRGGRFYGTDVPRTFGYYDPPVAVYDEANEAKFLRAEATRMKEALDEIEKRLEELEKG